MHLANNTLQACHKLEQSDEEYECLSCDYPVNVKKESMNENHCTVIN